MISATGPHGRQCFHLERSRYFFIKVAQLSTRDWVNRVPDPFSENGSAGNRTWDHNIKVLLMWLLIRWCVWKKTAGRAVSAWQPECKEAILWKVKGYICVVRPKSSGNITLLHLAWILFCIITFIVVLLGAYKQIRAFLPLWNTSWKCFFVRVFSTAIVSAWVSWTVPNFRPFNFIFILGQRKKSNGAGDNLRKKFGSSWSRWSSLQTSKWCCFCSFCSSRLALTSSQSSCSVPLAVFVVMYHNLVPRYCISASRYMLYYHFLFNTVFHVTLVRQGLKWE
jgi:hypothetical protein